uniref:Reverse transcriptase domain-containing protein n=1 Tax=Tanacetum cinerariifolium TaxID=118510 RepID=A0A6L2LCD3_TANCI|nr:hypothetical protein [Tanacetum cinerariifolium]
MSHMLRRNAESATSVETNMPSIRRIDASQYVVSNLQNRNLFSMSKKTTLPSSNRLNDDYWDELKETDGEKDLEAHYTNAKPLGKALPRKEKDLRSFTLPRFIKNVCFNRALAYLGESNVLVGIDKFSFPVYFIILDILEDFKTPLIIGRPFLSTAHFKTPLNIGIKGCYYVTLSHMLRRNLGDSLSRKGYDDSFLRYKRLLHNPLGVLHRKVPWTLHFDAFLVQIPCLLLKCSLGS